MTRLLPSLALFGAAMCSALAFSGAAAAACSGADTAALVACINTLEAKVDSLQSEVSALKAKADNPATEQKLSALVAENAQLSARVSTMAADEEGGSAGDTVKAPFVVTNDAGYPIFKVVSKGGTGAELIVGGTNQVQILGNGDVGQITLAAPGGRIGLWSVGAKASNFSMGTNSASTILLQDFGSDGEGALIRVAKGKEGTVTMDATKDMIGFRVFTAEKEQANLGVPPGKLGAVRIFSDSKQVAAMGARPDGNGAGAVYLGNGMTNGVTLLSSNNAEGSLSLLRGGELPVIQLRAFDTSIGIYDDDGLALASLMMSQNSKGGNLTLNNSKGEGVVSGGGTTAGDGALCVSRIKTGQTCLGVGLPLR